ncbi:MAG: hypothetical protein KJO07_08065, partial [Deltaproteobacteria bacterium]|nr:hypothetical protein [Deltaproteobacteria bacterium]
MYRIVAIATLVVGLSCKKDEPPARSRTETAAKAETAKTAPIDAAPPTTYWGLVVLESGVLYEVTPGGRAKLAEVVGTKCDSDLTTGVVWVWGSENVVGFDYQDRKVHTAIEAKSGAIAELSGFSNEEERAVFGAGSDLRDGDVCSAAVLVLPANGKPKLSHKQTDMPVDDSNEDMDCSGD